jgi:DNA invertase Pin-like site-specific DNA recombinase
VTEGLDLSTPAGRKFARDLASAAEYEREVRAERQAAGIAAAKAEGKRWGGCKPGTRKYVKDEQIAAIKTLHAQDMAIAHIARAVGVSRPTVYTVLGLARGKEVAR